MEREIYKEIIHDLKGSIEQRIMRNLSNSNLSKASAFLELQILIEEAEDAPKAMS